MDVSIWHWRKIYFYFNYLYCNAIKFPLQCPPKNKVYVVYYSVSQMLGYVPQMEHHNGWFYCIKSNVWFYKKLHLQFGSHVDV